MPAAALPWEAPSLYDLAIMTARPFKPVTAERVRSTLGSVFGYTSFRPLQEEIVGSILGGRDVFVLMPTGGGKSLCYQLPALLLDGLTIVVSPLIALMKDQVDALQAAGAPATFINSSLDPAEIYTRQGQVRRGEIKLLYVAPERLMLPGFLNTLAGLDIRCIAIDEAHCISEWGHDFRPEYRELRRLRQVFPAATLATFTATATPRVQADIIDQLGLQKAAAFRGSFNRPNLFYEVLPKQNAYGQLTSYLRRRRGASGIIYCQSRKGTEELAARLSADGFPAAAYHAGLPSEERQRRQDAFIKDDVAIIVATIAFGMGIDKPDVRFVVHYDLPKNLEGYYQESGRAGRDGEPSDCLLFYSYGDVTKYQRFIAEISSERERAVAQRQLKQMADWASGHVCRRRALLAYFDEEFSRQDGACCDICRGPAEGATMIDRSDLVRAFLECAVRTGERFGQVYLTGILRGLPDERVTRYRHDTLPIWAAGSALPAQEWRQLVGELVRGGYIRLAEEDYNAVKLTQRGRIVLAGDERVLLVAPPPKAPRASRRRTAVDTPDVSSTVDGSLFERLRVLRKQLADERKLPPYVIFHDSTLRAMAAIQPRSLVELFDVPGIGQRKADDYGEAFLAVIARHRGGPPSNQVTPKRREPSAAPVRTQRAQTWSGPSRPAEPPEQIEQQRPLTTIERPAAEASASSARGYRPAANPTAASRGAVANATLPTATIAATVALFNQGRSPLSIAAERRLGLQSVEDHLAAAIEAGEPAIDIRRLLSEGKQRAIEAVMVELGASPLKPIMERLGEGYSYGELKWVRAALNHAGRSA